MRKRSLFLGLLAVASLVVTSGVVLAAGGGGFGQPGTTTFNDLSASAALTDSGGGFLFLSVDRGVQTFKLRGVNGPPVMTGPETVLNYFSNGPSGSSSSGCFVIPDSSFVVATGLSTATLTVDPSIETPCPGMLLSPEAGGRPGLAGPAPAGGGGGGGFSQPITANLTWTSNGAVTNSNISTNSRCQSAVASSVGSSSLTFSTVSGSVSPLIDITTQFASIDEFKTNVTIANTLSAACIGA
jgi:hypothetical protein